MDRPSDLVAYHDWCRRELGCNFEDPAVRNAYEMTVAAASDNIAGSHLWTSLPSVMEEVARDYRQTYSCDLLSMATPNPVLVKKPFESAVNKSFRLNVLWNRNFPLEPSGGFVTPDTWFSQLDDVIRTTIVCRYIDGPSRLIAALTKRATQLGLAVTDRSVSRDEGYYGHHFYTRHPTLVARHNSVAEDGSVSLEIQVTTQMQDLLRALTHRFYEEDRLRSKPDSSWKWDFQSRKFTARYLAHTLHLVEALVVKVRDGADEHDS